MSRSVAQPYWVRALNWSHVHYLIVNPVAGQGRALAKLTAVQQFFADAQLPLTTLHTHYPNHATALVHTLPEDAHVLSLGGDGTLHEIAAACVHTRRVVGILPGGSGDDLAYALNIPRDNLNTALNIIEAGCVAKVDTGRVNGETFINAFGVGFDADVAYRVRHAPRPLRERSAYLYAILATLGRLEHIPVHMTLDGTPVFSGPALLVAVQNGPRTGGSFLFAPHASPFDGLLDIVVAQQVNRAGVVRLLPRLLKGTHLTHPAVLSFRGLELNIKWDRARPGHMEGELLTPTDTFTVRVQPKSLNVFVERNEDRKS